MKNIYDNLPTHKHFEFIFLFKCGNTRKFSEINGELETSISSGEREILIFKNRMEKYSVVLNPTLQCTNRIR